MKRSPLKFLIWPYIEERREQAKRLCYHTLSKHLGIRLQNGQNIYIYLLMTNREWWRIHLYNGQSTPDSWLVHLGCKGDSFFCRVGLVSWIWCRARTGEHPFCGNGRVINKHPLHNTSSPWVRSSQIVKHVAEDHLNHCRGYGSKSTHRTNRPWPYWLGHTSWQNMCWKIDLQKKKKT